tara:strand:- start:159 stop:860 length:702 start_codon:yes stop_codon:yes gene_type:complete
MPVKRFASEIFNALPDRVNMFGRYITGFGGDGLKLDKSTENALVRATEKPPVTIVPNTPEIDHDKTVEAFVKARETGKFEPVFTGRMIDKQVAGFGPGIPTSGPVSTPYTKGSSKEVTQTLGRFNAQVTPQEVRLTDRYDMVNEFEDPDLVSGKFQPGKAINNLIGTFDASKEFDMKTGKLKDVSHRNMSQEQYDKQRAASPTSSKATELARSLMYLLPTKPKAYDVDYTIQR